MPILENIDVWKEAVDLAQVIYKICKNNSSICQDFGLRDQLQRSAVSIASNIAEGNDRNGNKEFLRFLYIARGSCSELKTQLYIIKGLGYLEESDFDILLEKNIRVHKMLNGLIKSISK